jgi:hypothetical protein
MDKLGEHACAFAGVVKFVVDLPYKKEKRTRTAIEAVSTES